MLFLTEQDVKAAVSGDDAYKEAVGVIEQVLKQQSAGSTFHLKRYTMTHPAHPGHLWHNIRILPGMVPDLGAAAVRVYSGYRGTNRSEIICLFDWAPTEQTTVCEPMLAMEVIFEATTKDLLYHVRAITIASHGPFI